MSSDKVGPPVFTPHAHGRPSFFVPASRRTFLFPESLRFRSGEATREGANVILRNISVLIDYLFITGPSLGLLDCPWEAKTKPHLSLSPRSIRRSEASFLRMGIHGWHVRRLGCGKAITVKLVVVTGRLVRWVDGTNPLTIVESLVCYSCIPYTLSSPS